MSGSLSEGMLKGRVFSSALPNGFRIYVFRKPEAPAVSVQAWVATGSVNEGGQLGCGLSHFLEHMLFQGTKSFPGLKAAETVHSLGGDMNAYTSYNCTVYYVSLPSKSFKKGVEILSDMLMNPSLPKARFVLEKDVILRERDMNLDRPERVLSEQLWREMFLVHPVRHPIIGYRDKIAQVSRDLAAQYHELRYSPMRSFLTVVGDVDEEEAVKIASESFSSWRLGSIEEPPLPKEPAQCCRRERTGSFRDPLARVCAGWRSPDASHPDVPAIDMLTSIAGGGQSSRMERILKTELELAIDSSAFNYSTNFEGVAGFEASCQPEKLDKLVEASLDIFRSIREKGVSEAELARNVARQRAEYLRSLRSNSMIAKLIGGTVMTFGSPDYADNYIQSLSSLTKEDVARVAESRFSESALTVVKLLPENFATKAKAAAASLPKSSTPSLRVSKGGQRMIHFQDSSLPLVEFCAVLPGGLIREAPGSAGVSRLLASCMTCGTDKLSETELAELFDDKAADFSAFSGANTLSLRLNCPKEGLDEVMDAVAGILAKPSVPERQFERERRNLSDILGSRKAAPQNVACDKLCSLLFGQHPYAFSAGASDEALKSLGAEDVRRFRLERCMIPSKAVFGFSGDIDSSEAFARMEKLIAACEWSSSANFLLPSEPVFPSKSSLTKIRLEKQQAVIICGFPACTNASEDRESLELLCTASNDQSSKLFKAIREDEGLAYYSGLILSAGIHRGYLAYYAGTDPKKASKTLSLLRKERKRVACKGLDAKEFSSAMECMLHDAAEEMQNCGNVLFNAALSEFYSLGFEAPWKRPEIISKLKRDFVNERVAKHLDGAIETAVLVSPVA